jgi:ELWxxDGT repeat protein
MVKDINPGSGNSNPQDLTNVAGTLFFAANDGSHGYELWRSDGSAAGTQMVADVGGATSLTNFGGTLFFSAPVTGGHPIDGLWRSDGTSGGTQILRDIDAPEMTSVGGTLFLSAADATHGFQLWRSDGSADGTQMITDINPGGFNGLSFGPGLLTNVDGTLFFRANDGVHGDELWRTDGTAVGTQMVKDVYPGNAGSNLDPINMNGTLFFITGDQNGHQLWRSDGTGSGTQMLSDVQLIGNSYSDGYFSVTGVDGTLFFAADDGHGNELWRSDGTSAGTQMVKVFNPDTFRSPVPTYLTNVAGTLFFSADDAIHGPELWRSNGTTAGTQLVQDIYPGNYGSLPDYLANIRGTLFFGATDNIHGEGFWDLPVSPEQLTGTSLSVAPNNKFFGSAITLTADVSTAAGTFAGTTGTVDFMDGATTLASGVPLSDLTATGGRATLVIPSGNTLAVGAHHFHAVYSGDNNFATSEDSQSVSISQAVAETTIALSPSKDSNGNGSSVYGQNWAATASVGALGGFGGGAPANGSVQFTDTIVTNSSSSGTFLLGGKTTITLGSVPVSAGGVAILNAGVATGVILPGVITGYRSNGTRANLSPVTHIIKAQYSGNADFTAGNLSAGLGEIISRDTTQTVIKAATPTPAQYAQVVTITATVRSVSSLIAPVGSVTFTDSYTQGGVTSHTILGTVILPSVSAGVSQVQATFTTSSLAQAAHSLQAIYNGDTAAPFPLPSTFPYRGQWLPSTSGVYGLPVRGDTTTATLSAIPSGGQTAGSAITFIDSLTATAGGPVHGGIVTFKDGTKVLGSTSVDIRGKATLVTSIAGPIGTHSITAYYAGSMNFNASTSNTLAYTIRAANATTLFLASVSGNGQGQWPALPAQKAGVFGAMPSHSPPGPLPGASGAAPGAGTGEASTESRRTSAGAQHPAAGTLVKAQLDEDWL